MGATTSDGIADNAFPVRMDFPGFGSLEIFLSFVSTVAATGVGFLRPLEWLVVEFFAGGAGVASAIPFCSSRALDFDVRKEVFREIVLTGEAILSSSRSLLSSSS